MSPSKYEPEIKEPLCMGRRTKSFVAGSVQGAGRFGCGTHTPWEEFQNTISARTYQKVIGGTTYPKRAQFDNEDAWVQALDAKHRTLKPKAGIRSELH